MSSESSKKKKNETTTKKKKTKSKAEVEDFLKGKDYRLNADFIKKLHEFILINIRQFSNDNIVENQRQYHTFIHENIYLMNPVFFEAGEDFMNLVFEETQATEQVKINFLRNWNTLRYLSSKLFEFVKLQINLMARRNPKKDQQQWKDFIVNNIQLMNDDFFLLGKRIFNYLLNESIDDDILKRHFSKAWSKTEETILKIKKTPENN